MNYNTERNDSETLNSFKAIQTRIEDLTAKRAKQINDVNSLSKESVPDYSQYSETGLQQKLSKMKSEMEISQDSDFYTECTFAESNLNKLVTQWDKERMIKATDVDVLKKISNDMGTSADVTLKLLDQYAAITDTITLFNNKTDLNRFCLKRKAALNLIGKESDIDRQVWESINKEKREISEIDTILLNVSENVKNLRADRITFKGSQYKDPFRVKS